MKRAVYVYEHEARGYIPIFLPKPRRFAFGDHGGWREKLNELTNRGLRLVATGCEEGAMAAHFAPTR